MNICICTIFVSSAMEVRWCSKIPWNWSYRILLTATLALEIKHKTSARAEVLLSPAPSLYTLIYAFLKDFINIHLLRECLCVHLPAWVRCWCMTHELRWKDAFQGLNSCCQPWPRMSLPPEPSYCPHIKKLSPFLLKRSTLWLVALLCAYEPLTRK